MKYALIGCGRIAANHIRAALENRLEIAAVCDVRPEAMEALLDLCMEFGRAYQKEKLRRNATDFSDQEHYAIRLLLGEDGRPTPLAAVTAEEEKAATVRFRGLS